MGDVIYSGYVMGEIVDCYAPIKIFGNATEIFAIVFDKQVHGKVRNALRKGSKTEYGKLRNFFHAYSGFEKGKGIAEPLDDNEIFFRTHDWTRDIDTKHEYIRAQIEIEDTRVMEELPI